MSQIDFATQAGVPISVANGQQFDPSLLEPGDIDSVLRGPNEAPIPPLPAYTTVALPGGFIDSSGTLHRTAQVREMCGEDEEELARIGRDGKPLLKNQASIIDKVLSMCVDSIGSISPVTLMVASNLLLGDRMALVLGVRMVTYGNMMEYTVKCPGCDTEERLEILLDEDIPTKTLEDPTKSVYEVPLRHGTAKIRFTTGADELAAMGAEENKTIPQINTALLSRIVLEINGKRTTPTDIRRMNSADRSKIITFLGDNQPGPDLGGVKLPCTTCGADNFIRLDLADLLWRN